jgi:hypothetical protein
MAKQQMRFQPGDHVLWWGEVGVLSRPSYVRGATIVKMMRGGEEHINVDRLAAHQRPWRYDKALGGWVPE